MKFYLIILMMVLKPGTSHSWLDCTDRREDGSCGGFIRNFQGHYDQLSSYKILNHDPSTLLCEPRFQSQAIYTSQFPMAKSLPGQRLYFDYLENGHITIDKLPPDNKPHPRHYAVYWTGKKINESNSQMVYRGDIMNLMPLEMRSFDDGECSDVNTEFRLGPTPCIGGYTIPLGTSPGVYQLAWVWHYDRDNHGRGEEYTSCFEVEVVSKPEYDQHLKIKFPSFDPYNFAAIGMSPRSSRAPIDSTLAMPVNCNLRDSFDASKYACLANGTALCPIGNDVCGQGQCFNPQSHQCCFNSILLNINQPCNILNNPFQRLQRLKASGF